MIAHFSRMTAHMVGIGGVGMCGVARMLLAEGARVTGSDLMELSNVRLLRSLGAEIVIGHSAGNIPPDATLVVTSAAIKESNPEVVAARERGLEVVKYSEMLGRLMEERRGIAIAGTHGKTTTTAMVTAGLEHCGKSPSYLIGGDLPALGGSSRAGEGEFFVAEACEYDRSFLNLRPEIAVITNIEEDHLDYYRDLGEIEEAFVEFGRLLPREGLLVTREDDLACGRVAKEARCRAETFSLMAGGDWVGEVLGREGTRSRVLISRTGEDFLEFDLSVPGEHNVLNALAAVATLSGAGISADEMRPGLESFRGVRRRFQLLGEVGGVVFIDDYAHHPTEIKATLKAARDLFAKRRVWCVFQPHQHSRTRFLLEQFAGSFDDADVLIFPDIYFVRDSEVEKRRISSADLAREVSARGKEALYIPTFDEIMSSLRKRLEPGDVVITMGAGNIGELGHGMAQEFVETCAEG